MFRQNFDKKPVITVFSLDYDGCSDLLFYDIEKEFKSDGDIAKQRALSLKNQLDAFLNNSALGSQSVEVYVGSNRQDICDDETLAENNSNGSCFKNLAVLCQERNWLFRRLLLADVRNNLEPGTAMNDSGVYCNIPSNTNKNEIILNQIKDIRKNRPDAEINFYFFDDKKDSILKNTHEYFKADESLLQNVNLIFIHFDWFDYIIENKATLTEYARITPEKPEVAKDSWDWKYVAGAVVAAGLFAAAAYKAREYMIEDDLDLLDEKGFGL